VDDSVRQTAAFQQLVEICRTALSQDPSQRFASLSAFANALQRVTTHPRRNLWLRSVAALMICAGMTFLTMACWGAPEPFVGLRLLSHVLVHDDWVPLPAVDEVPLGTPLQVHVQSSDPEQLQVFLVLGTHAVVPCAPLQSAVEVPGMLGFPQPEGGLPLTALADCNLLLSVVHRPDEPAVPAEIASLLAGFDWTLPEEIRELPWCDAASDPAARSLLERTLAESDHPNAQRRCRELLSRLDARFPRYQAVFFRKGEGEL
jgi:hypothetical protein